MIIIILKKISKYLLIRVLLKKEREFLGMIRANVFKSKLINKPIRYLLVFLVMPRLNCGVFLVALLSQRWLYYLA